jgi:hypothetical protein
MTAAGDNVVIDAAIPVTELTDVWAFQDQV